MSSIISPIAEAAAAHATLEAFAYGEHLEGARSLGFRLVSPESPRPWGREVNALARRLQAATVPEQWPSADLFCSVLLDSGQRLIGLARYGLADHTPSRRRGGLELVGLIAPASLSLHAVMSIAHWLRQRRSALERLTDFTGTFDVVGVLAEAPLPPALTGTALPRPLGSERFLVIPAASVGDPDQNLGMLNYLPERSWQWLPFVSADFPLADIAQRGPVIAWTTPHSDGAAIKSEAVSANSERGPRSRWPIVVALLLIGLLGANAWYLSTIERRLAEVKPAPAAAPNDASLSRVPTPVVKSDDLKLDDQEALVQTLYHYLRARGCVPESRREQLLKNYERLVAADDSFRTASVEGRLALGAICDLSKRKSPAQVEALIRGLASDKKGIDERVLDLIAERVYQRLTEAD